MTQWISTTQDDYVAKSTLIKSSSHFGDVKVEWSDDKTTCTTYVDGVACLQRMTYYNKRKVYYVNKAVFEEIGE